MKSTIFNKKKLALLVLALAPVFVQAALTDLAKNPITGRAELSLAPNVMFILDESLSMTGEFMPDWAGGFNNSNLLQNFGPDLSQTKNSSFNGIAYNPATTYYPPAFFTNTGFVDTDTYPSQTKEKTAGWTEVLNDPFTNKTAKIDLTQQNLVYFTTIPSEYCNSKAMLNCQVRSAPEIPPEPHDGQKYYTEPAYLRWCNSAVNATKGTPAAGACQAVEIDNIGTASKYGFPRMPWPFKSILTIPNGGGAITSITVNSQEILSAQTGAHSSGAGLAAAIQDSINKCSFETTDTTCGVAGYRAIASPSAAGSYIVSIYAPKQVTINLTPNVTGSVVLNPTQFTSINTNYVGFGGSQAGIKNEVAGINLPTIIFPGVQKYPKEKSRTDCKTDYCTYEEEMTNYANWHAYYRTRMQMMKTATSLAFSSTTDSFRIGFMTVNNKTGTNSMGGDFLNIKDFNSQQKHDWYVKLFATQPKGDTPLRQALDQAGRIYAGKLKGVYGIGDKSVNIIDPVQHSCQMNVTILSTDGYWNQGPGVRLDGATTVGDQDSSKVVPQVLRPQLDGGQPTFTITASQHKKTLTPQYRPQARVTTTTADHYQLQVSTKNVVQKRETPLQARSWNLQKTVWPLQMKEATLQTQTKRLLKSTWGEHQLISKWDVTAYQITQTTINNLIDKTTKTLKETTVPLKENIYQVKKNTYKLQKKSYTLTKIEYRLQVSHSQQAQKSTDGGVTYTDVDECISSKYGGVKCRYSTTPAKALTDVPVGGGCKPAVVTGYVWDSTRPNQGTPVNAGDDSQEAAFLTQTTCSYTPKSTPNLTTCTPTTSTVPTVPAGGTSVLKETSCSYVGSAKWDDVESGGTCVAGSASTSLKTEWKAYEECRYNPIKETYSSTESCTRNKSDASPYSVIDAVECAYKATSVTGQTNLSQCTASGTRQTSTDNGTVYSPYIECAYDEDNKKSVDVVAGNTCVTRVQDTSGTFLPEVTCTYSSNTDAVAQSTCTVSKLPADCTDTGNSLSCTQIIECSNPTSPETGPEDITTDCAESTTTDKIVTCGSRYLFGPTEMDHKPVDGGGVKYDSIQKAGDQVCGAPGLPDCIWSWSSWVIVDSCTPTHLVGSTNPASGATATRCKYDDNFMCTTGVDCWSAASSCKPNTNDTIAVGTAFTTLVNCQYSSYGEIAAAGSSCTSDGDVPGKNSLTNFTKSTWKSCGYWGGSSIEVESPADSCKIENSGKQTTTGSKGDELKGNVVLCDYDKVSDWDAASTCTPHPRPKIGNGNNTQSTATDCRYGPPGNWDKVPAGQTCTESSAQCTFPSADICTGGSCKNYPTCSVSPFVECATSGWSDWENVTDANAVESGVGCRADGNNSTTGDMKCQYVKVATKYYVGADAKDCSLINKPPVTNFTKGAIPLTAITNCKLNYIVPESSSGYWLDVNVDIRDLGVAAIIPGTIGRYPNPDSNTYTRTFQALHLPGYELPPGNKPNSPGIKDAPGYNLEVREGSVAGLTPKTSVVNSCDGVAINDDGTALHNKVTCATVSGTPQTGQVSCPTAEEMEPAAGNNWTTKTCVEVMGDATNDTLADVAQYYYMTDLRTENCTSPAGNDLCINNMEPTKSDPATWQHMVTYTLGLGASGFMQYDPNYRTADTGDFPAIAKGKVSNLAEGLCSWQLNNTTCNWPKPVTATQTNIDDLWHAAVNGRGVYYSAGEPNSLSLGLQDALGNIGQKEGSSSGVTLASSILTEGNNFVFYGGYTDGAWTGELVAREIDLATGMVEQDYCWYEDEPDVKLDCPASLDGTLPLGMKKKVVDPVWTAQEKLDNKTPGTRRIYTYAGIGAKKTFEWSKLTTDEKGFFSETHIATLPQMCKEADISCLSDTQRADAAGENLVNFLRGDRTHEDSDKIGFYRKREHLLGDIVNAAPAYVRGSNFLYTDKGYWKFKMDTQNRRPMVYAAANDGMLHAFYAETDTPQNIVGGAEAWAYVPRLVMPNLFNLASKNYKENHRFFVDGTPVVGDICTANCPVTNETPAVWRTILVGGLNHGGNGYYALDITDPENPEVLWEFTHVNMGYTFGNPVITKLKPEGKWVVMFTSGYNNVLPSEEDNTQTGDGKGHLFIVDAVTGELFEDRVITTGVGSPEEPSGLSRINVWVDYPLYDNTAERVYGGDLFGNLWRFDINGHGTANSYYAQLLAVLKNKDGAIQPITAKPELGKIDNKPIVFVGTGKLLGPTDMLSASWQSFYGIYDPVFDVETTAITASEAIYDNPRSLGNDFVKQLFKSELCTIEQIEEDKCEMVGGKAELTTRAVDFSQGKKGWYVDFMVKAERADTDSYLTRGTIVINTNVPTEATECAPGGYNNRYYINAATGGAFGEGEWGDAGGYRSEGLVANTTVGVVGDRMIDYNQIDGRKDIDEGEPPFEAIPPIPRRLSWRQLLTDN